MVNELISIIVPVYNVERFLDRCIKSLTSQTYQNIEIILVDDGSTDNCPQICDDFAKKDKRIRAIHKANGGLSSARNVGIDAAKGEYISFVDSDDYIAADMIERAYRAIAGQNADLCIFGIKWIYESGAAYDKVLASPICDEILTKNQALDKLCGSDYFYYVTSVNKLYKRTIFDNIRFPEGKQHEDEFTVHHIFDSCSKIVSIKDDLYFYVQRDNSIMHSYFSVKRIDGVYAFLDRCNYAKRKKLKELKFQSYCQAYSLAMSCLRYCDFYKNKKKLKKMVRDVVKADLFNLRNIKLLALYFKKKARTSLSLMKFKLYEFKTFHQKKEPGVVLVATPQHGNLGDQAIVAAEYKLLDNIFPEKKIYEIPNGYYSAYGDLIKKHITEKDIIVIDGGGNLGTLWEWEDDKITKIISDYKDNKIVIFPQTCFYKENSENRINKNKIVYESAKDLTVMLREKQSYALFHNLFPNTKSILLPDVVLSLKPQIKNKKRKGVLICFRNDRERVVANEVKKQIADYLTQNGVEYKESSTVIDKKVNKSNRERELKSKFEEFSSSELVITDRLHAMIFAAITKTPCIAFDNSSKKVSGVYAWIKDNKTILCLDDADKVADNIYKMLNCNAKADDFVYPTEEVRNILNDKN